MVIVGKRWMDDIEKWLEVMSWRERWEMVKGVEVIGEKVCREIWQRDLW